ncbi:hypothetical protein DRQ33_02330, partial [bacterium]
MRSLILTMFTISFVLAQADITPQKPEIYVDISPNECELPSYFSQAISFSSIQNVYFFDPETAEIDSNSLDYLIRVYGTFLSRNPDAIMNLKGYYSPEIDDILSPT